MDLQHNNSLKHKVKMQNSSELGWSARKISPCFKLLMATGVVLFQRPSHTSPNWPWPSLRTNFKLVRSISHWSRVEWDRSAVTGFSTYRKKNQNQFFEKNLLSSGWCLYACFSKVHTESISFSAVMINKVLQRSKGCPSCNEKTTIIQLSNSVISHSICQIFEGDTHILQSH